MDRRTALLAHALAPIQPYLDATDVTEVLANPDGQLWVERHGSHGMQAVGSLEATARSLIIRLVAGTQDLVCTATHPSLATVLPSGHRFQGFVPPLTAAPSFVIRSHQAQILRREDYLRAGVCSAATWDTITTAIQARENVLMVGGTSSGKTTLMNSVIATIDPRHRLVTIEDTRELHIALPNWLPLYTSAELSMAAAVKASLRSRPDRIIPGEVRDGQTAIAVLRAWGSGHPGGVCTFHANHAADALPQWEDLCAEAEPGHYAPRIGRTIGLVIGLARSHGARKITSLIRCHGWKEGQYVTEDVLSCPTGRPHVPRTGPGCGPDP